MSNKNNHKVADNIQSIDMDNFIDALQKRLKIVAIVTGLIFLLIIGLIFAAAFTKGAIRHSLTIAYYGGFIIYFFASVVNDWLTIRIAKRDFSSDNENKDEYKSIARYTIFYVAYIMILISIAVLFHWLFFWGAL
ncbi:hypothetical protein MNBD_GAMMA12-1195 [hydrothermal vent metagenome]|uniref:Uncharacterized protein n=1 Tax=hydrothermal vent metagenome TaxID=652676 RepID=A0A3B0YQB4_9ZZZZ